MNKLSELQRRDLIISFYKKHEELGKKFTMQHYVTEGISKRSIYHILQKYFARGSTARKAGSGGLNKKMSKAAGAAIVRHNVDKKCVSLRQLAKRHNVVPMTMSRLFKASGAT